MITAIHHIALIVSSEKCLAFYKCLGFQKTFRKEREHDVIVLMTGYGIQLEIFVDGKHPARSDLEPLGLRHFALRVDNIEKTLEELDFPNSPIKMDWVGNRFVFIHDPDGNVIELRE